MPFLYRASLNKWWFDDLNHLLFIVIGGRVAARLWWFDREVVDGTVNGIGARHPAEPAAASRQVQTGRVQNYALGIAARADRDGRLVPDAGGALTMDVVEHPDPVAHHLPAAGRRARRRRSRRRPLARPVALGVRAR